MTSVFRKKLTIVYLYLKIPFRADFSIVLDAKIMDYSAFFRYNDIMKTDVNFIFQEDAQRIFNHFTRLLGIKITFFTTDFVEVRSGANRGHCRYCKLLRTKLGCEPLCRNLDRKKQIQALHEKRLVFYQCHGGMVEAILPVFTVNNLVGYIMIGQFRARDKCPVKYCNRWGKKYGNDRLYKAFLEAPYYPKKKLADIFGLFELIVDSIITHHLIATKTASSLEKLISYVNRNPQVNLTLSQAADMMCRSPSSISHEFKRATGINFKKYIILKKLEKAEELMAGNTELKIHEIARKVGYSDPYLFSRIYKKHRHHPPSQFKLASN